MTLALAALERLQTIPNLTVQTGALLRNYTRFRLGGPCQALVSTVSEAAYLAALGVLSGSDVTWTTIGGGTNLIVSDAGYPGLVLQYNAVAITMEGAGVRVEAGAELNDLVDFATAQGLAGIESMAGIPGWVGAAIYGNAGAYGQSIAERVDWVRFAVDREVFSLTALNVSSAIGRASLSGTKRGRFFRPGCNSNRAIRLRWRQSPG